MPPRPRLLFVSRNPPTGRGSGARIRAGVFLQALLPHYEVHLLVVAPEMTDADLAEPLLQQCASVSVDRMDWSSRRRRDRFGPSSTTLRYLYEVLRCDPANALRIGHDEARALASRLPSVDFDAVVAIRLSMARLAQQLLDWGLLRARTRVFDLDDIESRLAARERALHRDRDGLAVTLGKFIEQRRLAAAEERLIATWNQVYVCSVADSALLAARHPRGDIRAVPNTTAPIAPVPAQQAVPLQLLFVGSMRYPPNDDAARHFCNDVLPLLTERLGEVPHTRIVGIGPGAALRALHGREGVEVVGAVDDIADAYRSASLVIVPIRFGGGTRIKIIEAMAAGRPVVSTALGAEGLGLRDGEELLIADTPDAFAAACARVLRDSALWQRLVTNGQSCYEARFAPPIVIAGFLQAFAEARGESG